MRRLPGLVARALKAASFLSLWCCLPAPTARGAEAGSDDAVEAARALAQAEAALAAKPPQTAEARRALNRVCASGTDPRLAAEARFRLGVLDEDELKFSLALSDYARSATEAPSSIWARNARRRMAWLKEHAEGDFVPLARFESARRAALPQSATPEVEALARDADSFPDGRTRSEARMLVAQTWLRMPQRSSEAAGELTKILTDASAEPKTQVFAERDLVGLWLARGEVDQAAAVVRAHPLEPQLVKKVDDLLRARRWRRGAVAIAVVALGLAALGLAGRRRWQAHGPSATPG